VTNSYSIHLSEPLSEADAKRVAEATAPALGGSPEKLQLLLSRQPGSRIARASNQRQAEQVANILRNAGAKVEVLENQGDGPVSVAATTPSSQPPAVSADSFAAPIPISSGDPFAADISSDPFAAPKNDPFVTPKSDPFSTPKNDPFAAPKSDPFAAPVKSGSSPDPFATYGGTVSDPFAAPVVANRTEIPLTAAPDPFAAPGSSAAVMDVRSTQSDLPPQARQARDRAPRRTSVRNRMLGNLITPILLVGVATAIFLGYLVNQIFEQQYQARARVASIVASSGVGASINGLPSVSAENQLKASATAVMKTIPELDVVFFAKEAQTPKQFLIVPKPGLTFAESEIERAEEILDSYERDGGGAGIVAIQGVKYAGAVIEVKNPSTNETVGDAYVLYTLKDVPTQVFNALIPLLVGLVIVVLLAIALAVALSHQLVRPILAATQQAERIALGDLDRTIEVRSNDEISDLVGSLEKMRVSLKSMVSRLRRDR
jgi:HAMP domain-containing protein